MGFRIQDRNEFYALAVFNSRFINYGRSSVFGGPDLACFGTYWQQRCKSFYER